MIQSQLNLIFWTNFFNSSARRVFSSCYHFQSSLTINRLQKVWYLYAKICLLQTPKGFQKFRTLFWGMKYFSMSFFYSVCVNWIFLWFSFQCNIQWPSTFKRNILKAKFMNGEVQGYWNNIQFQVAFLAIISNTPG